MSELNDYFVNNLISLSREKIRSFCKNNNIKYNKRYALTREDICSAKRKKLKIKLS